MPPSGSLKRAGRRREGASPARRFRPRAGPARHSRPYHRPMIVLGIETSCDETAAAVVSDGGGKRILADRIRSQLDEHRPYGGIVPEIAARAHLEALDPLILGALADAGIGFADLDAVAFTGGPGLIGGVIVGTMA